MLREQGRVRALLSNTRKWKKTQICTQGFRSLNHYNNGRTWPGFCLCSSGDAVTHRPLCFCFIWPSTLDWNWEISALKFRSGLDQLSKPPMRFVLIYKHFSIWLLPFYVHECISSPKMNSTQKKIFLRIMGIHWLLFPILLKSTALKSKYLLLCSFGTTENSV